MKNERYNYYKERHPEWSEEQILMAVSIELEADKTLSSPVDVNINDPNILGGIIKRARDWMEEVLPEVLEKVAYIFDKILSNITKWVKKGLEWLLRVLGDEEFIN